METVLHRLHVLCLHHHETIIITRGHRERFTQTFSKGLRRRGDSQRTLANALRKEFQRTSCTWRPVSSPRTWRTCLISCLGIHNEKLVTPTFRCCTTCGGAVEEFRCRRRAYRMINGRLSCLCLRSLSFITDHAFESAN